jgi:hypothetical protein
MSFFIILAFTAIALFFIAFKLFGSNSTHSAVVEPHQEHHESICLSGFAKVDLTDATTISITLVRDSFIRFKNQNRVKGVETVQEPQNNRYCYYSCNLGEDDLQNDRKIQLNLELNDKTLNFEHVYNLLLKQTNDSIEEVEFELVWSKANSTLEQAFQDYKRFMQDLLDLGCQNYFGPEDIRYKKEDYNKILASGDHTCLAPDLIQFDEFKSVLESEKFRTLDSYFYMGDFEISISYNRDYSATFEIRYLASIYSALSYFGTDDLYLDELSINEKQIKLENYREECSRARKEEEEEIKQAGFEVDEDYKDPFIQFKI